MEKMERKIVIILTLIKKMEKHCKKSLKIKEIRKDPYSLGHISGELRILEIMKQFTEEARRK